MQVIGHILPIALAVAISSVPITATIIPLLSLNRSRSGAPLLIGWVLGMLVTLTSFSLGILLDPAGVPK